MRLAILLGFVCLGLGRGQAAAQPLVMINEIMSNPVTVSDASGEWFELFNPNPYPVDINGWTLRGGGEGEMHVISAGAPLLIQASGYVVLGVSADQVQNGGLVVNYVYAGFTLANTSDQIDLLAPNGAVVDTVRYGPLFPLVAGRSIEVINPLLDNDAGANWVAATSLFGAGDFGTPGAANSMYESGDADFDGDGDVDGRDFLIWQRNAGATSGVSHADGDVSGDLAVNGWDLAVWQTQFGATGSVAAGGALVPEPRTMLAAATIAAAAMCRRRRAG